MIFTIHNFSPVICQFWLGQLRTFRKIYVLSKCSPGHVECSFDKTNRKFFAHFFSVRLIISCYFSHSSNWSLQFIDVPPDFFSVVAIQNRQGSHNKSPESNPTTSRFLKKHFLSTSTWQYSFSTVESFIFGLRKTFSPNFFQSKLIFLEQYRVFWLEFQLYDKSSDNTGKVMKFYYKLNIRKNCKLEKIVHFAVLHIYILFLTRISGSTTFR